MRQFSTRLDNKSKNETQDNFKKSELNQANYEADHHIYAGSANSIEEFKKEISK